MLSKQALSESDLILNPDGSVYHLNLLPEDLADTVILVGDPDRVPKVSKYFDRIELKKKKREFVTHTGYIGRQRFTALSTGIGTDNIDIVMNELDALANIDLPNRKVHKKKKSLQLVRLGTSGAMQAEIALDSLVVSGYGLGIDGLLGFYGQPAPPAATRALLDVLYKALPHTRRDPRIYLAPANKQLLKLLSPGHTTGITITCPGFYGPQARSLRLQLQAPSLLESIVAIRKGAFRITNGEMETAAIYGLAALLGHKACSVNAIVANRPLGIFSKQPHQTVDGMIRMALERLSGSK